MVPPDLKWIDGVKDSAGDGAAFAEVLRSGSASADDVLFVHLGDFYLRINIETFHIVENRNMIRNVFLQSLKKKSGFQNPQLTKRGTAAKPSLRKSDVN